MVTGLQVVLSPTRRLFEAIGRRWHSGRLLTLTA